MDTHIYSIGKNLYVNLTNRCTNRCAFCVRDQSAQYEGYSLWLKEGEPSAEQVISEMGDLKGYDEVVFCGYGEPTYRLEEMIKICDFVHSRGIRTRLNTNGHANVINGGDIAGKIKGKIDLVNISLNSPTEEGYNEVCRPKIEGAYAALLGFAESCKKAGVNCLFSVVDCIGDEQVEKCREIAEKVGIPLRVREYIG